MLTPPPKRNSTRRRSTSVVPAASPIAPSPAKRMVPFVSVMSFGKVFAAPNSCVPGPSTRMRSSAENPERGAVQRRVAFVAAYQVCGAAAASGQAISYVRASSASGVCTPPAPRRARPVASAARSSVKARVKTSPAKRTKPSAAKVARSPSAANVAVRPPVSKSGAAPPSQFAAVARRVSAPPPVHVAAEGVSGAPVFETT